MSLCPKKFFYFLIFFSLFISPKIQAATITVTSAGDSGAGTLRQAILDASSADTVNFDSSLSGQTITLTTGDITLSIPLTITGLGSNALTISGGNTSGIFNVLAGATNLVMTGLTLEEGLVTTNGGAIYNNGGVMSLTDVNIQNCVASSNGGGIYSNGTLTIINSTLSGNTANTDQGGAIRNDGTLTLQNVEISNNVVLTSAGGGITNFGEMSVTDCTISGNSALLGAAGVWVNSSSASTFNRVTISGNTATSSTAFGGGISVSGTGTVTITNSTVSGNSVVGAGSEGGGLHANGATLVELNNVTISGNSAVSSGGGMIAYNASVVTLSNTIVANSSAGGDCAGGTYTDNGNNIVEDNSCGFTGGSDPLLGSLADNGGLTLTLALTSSSPAIDAGDDATCEAIDQRGVTRPQGSACDIGAFEFSPTNLAFSAATYSVDEDAGTVTITVQRALDDTGGAYDGEVTVDYATSDGSAVAGTNYTATTGTLTWTANDNADQTFTVDITDNSSTIDGTFDLTLTNPTGGSSIGTISTAVVTIVGTGSGGGGGSSGTLGGGTCLQSLQSNVEVSYLSLAFMFASLFVLGGMRRLQK